MNRHHRQLRSRFIAGRAVLFAVALLGGCGRKDNLPQPPSSPPRPMTSVHRHVRTAELKLHTLPALPKRGMM